MCRPPLSLRRSALPAGYRRNADHAQPAGAQGASRCRQGPGRITRTAALLHARAQPARRRGDHRTLSVQRQRPALHHGHRACAARRHRRLSGARHRSGRSCGVPDGGRLTQALRAIFQGGVQRHRHRPVCRGVAARLRRAGGAHGNLHLCRRACRPASQALRRHHLPHPGAGHIRPRQDHPRRRSADAQGCVPPQLHPPHHHPLHGRHSHCGVDRGPAADVQVGGGRRRTRARRRVDDGCGRGPADRAGAVCVSRRACRTITIEPEAENRHDEGRRNRISPP